MITGMIERTSGGLFDQGLRTGEGFLKGDMDESLINKGLGALGLEDSAAGKVLTTMAAPIATQLRGTIINKLTGTSDQTISTSDLLSNETALEKAKNAEENAYTATNISPSIQGVADGQADEATVKAYQVALGYNRKTAEKKVAKGGLDVSIMRGVAAAGVEGTKESATEASRELAKRVSNPRDVSKFAAEAQGAMYKADIQQNKFSGLSREDKSFLLSDSVRQGAADGKGSAAMKADRAVNAAASKAEGMANLRSVYGDSESSENLINRMNALKGENVLAQRGDNFARQTESLQQIKRNTGVSDKELATLTANSYKDIAAFGGRTGLAQSTAEATIRLTSGSSTKVSGLSDAEYKQNMSGFVADTVRRGDTRNVATAYRLWLDKNKEQNSTESFQKFQEQTKNMDLTSSKGVYDFIKKTTGETGVKAQQTFHSVFNSEATKELEQDSNILAEATSKRLEESSKGYIEEAKKAVGGDKQFKKLFGSEEEFKQKSAEDIRSTLIEKSDKLGGIGKAYKIADRIQGAAEQSAIATGMDTKSWQQAQISSKKSKEIANKDITNVKRFQELDKGKGIEGISRMIEEKAAKREGVTPAELLSQGALGINNEQLGALSAPTDANIMDASYAKALETGVSDSKRRHGLDSVDIARERGMTSGDQGGGLESPLTNPNIQGLTAIADPVNKILAYVQEIARRGN